MLHSIDIWDITALGKFSNKGYIVTFNRNRDKFGKFKQQAGLG